jgi:hypothetical protein
MATNNAAGIDPSKSHVNPDRANENQFVADGTIL